ncbi:MAG: molybdopterin guanine dinucleotide-containing S/N-oxide reductase [Burkholderiaceae bacterium]
MQTHSGDQTSMTIGAPPRGRTYTTTHWGIYEVRYENGQAVALEGFAQDPSPSPIGLSMLDAVKGPLRIARPSVRRSWLAAARGEATDSRRDLRGQEAFVEIEWSEALDLVAAEISRVRGEHGNTSIFGGSYGWSSAGRFHHAQSQVHRFLNSVGGYVRHADSYSLGAARVLMPHIVAPMDEMHTLHTSWNVMAIHTQLFVSFGGVPAKNAQVSSGGATEHLVPTSLKRMAEAGVRFVNVSPVKNDIDTGGEVEWIAIRPNTDTAMILALAHTLYRADLHDREFLARNCVGFDKFVPYLTGAADGQPKDAAWAEGITGVPAARIESLALAMASQRTMLTMAWSLQRSHHGEQPFWSLVTLAAMLGQIGLPGGGFGVGYGTTNMIGASNAKFSGPVLPQGTNAVRDFIPVARITDMLEKPGQAFDYNGARHKYPDIRLVYWAGGNPFHHHQDLNRMLAAWQRKPETIVVHEQFWTPSAKLADIVLPATTTLERDDIGYASRERFMVAMKQAIEPVGEARDDYDIFAALAERLGAHQVFTEGLSSAQWLSRLYEESRVRALKAGKELPPFEQFWQGDLLDLSVPDAEVVMFDAFRADPVAHPLNTPSGRIEIYSERIAGFDYEDCPGHAQWFEPVEWLGNAAAGAYPLHLLSDQPFTKLHSQLDHAGYSQGNKVGGREPITLSTADAQARSLTEGDLVRVFNDRGSCLAAVRISDEIRPGVVKLSTGAWFDPAQWRASGPGNLERHGNPNVLTLDIGASRLSQGCVAQTCLVQVERHVGSVPTLAPYALPEFEVAA